MLILGLAGCSGPVNPPPSTSNVTAAIVSLSTVADKAYPQPVNFRRPGTNKDEEQTIYLLPMRDGSGFRLVDGRGEIYDDYDDFLLRNDLTG